MPRRPLPRGSPCDDCARNGSGSSRRGGAGSRRSMSRAHARHVRAPASAHAHRAAQHPGCWRSYRRPARPTTLEADALPGARDLEGEPALRLGAGQVVQQAGGELGRSRLPRARGCARLLRAPRATAIFRPRGPDRRRGHGQPDPLAHGSCSHSAAGGLGGGRGCRPRA